MIRSLKEDIFYVYAYLDPRKPGDFIYNQWIFSFEPFYIGKGSGDRIFCSQHRTSFLKSKLNKIKKDCDEETIRVVIEDHLIEKKAFELEKELILLIGRKDIGEGPLINFTDGGEGSSNIIIKRKPWTKEQREAVSGPNHYQFGKQRSKETRNKISLGLKGRKVSLETRNKISNSLKKTYNLFGGNNKGKTFSDEVRKKWSECKMGPKNPMFGRKRGAIC